MIKFTGWEKGVYGTFRLESNVTQQGQLIDRILIAHEGDWLSPFAMLCREGYDNYEDVQEDLGDGFKFVGKEYSNLLNRSFFLYEIARPAKELGYKIAVPATGEEVYFEIYGLDSRNHLHLLWEQEL